jgi:DNA-binding MarR family transcriptional regulator
MGMIESELTMAEELIGKLRQFMMERELMPEDWKRQFASWLLNQGETELTEIHGEDQQLDIMVGMQLANTSNGIRMRLNRMIAGSPFSSSLDYQFLFVLAAHDRMTKSELIHGNSMEMSSGIEVVKRLIKNGWAVESENPRDRRSKLIAPSESGRRLLEQYGEAAGEIYSSFSRHLGASQKTELLKMLSMIDA